MGSSDSKERRTGTVIRSTGSWYQVQTNGDVVPSRLRGKMRLETGDVTNPIAVGDRVTIRITEDDKGFIEEIHERETKLARRAAGRRVGKEHIIVANVDRAWAVQAVRKPPFNNGFIDRFLVMTEVYELEAGIVFNKMDLCRDEDRERLDFFAELYRDLGYTVHRTSALTGDGVAALREDFTGQTNVVSGPSGVGKSALLNQIEPGLELKTGDVSDKTEKGKHTTTHASLHPLSGGGFVADTPGIREFGILELEPTHLAHYFVEFLPHLNDCRFPNCSHEHEPDCAVQQAVENGDITEVRYQSYLSILEALREGEENVGR